MSPDYAQVLIEMILKGLSIDCYIDNMGIWTNGTIDFHFKKVRTVLDRIGDNSLKCNPLKCDWAVKKSNFLGYWMTTTGGKPRGDQTNAVLKMGAP